MGYKPDSVAATVARLNSNYFLPAIQRQFVWGPEKIIRLFDSLLRGYPISSFLFWELKPENRNRWQIYKFIEDVEAGGSHNKLASTDGVQQLTLVLDGQQRLTSLSIGLKGTYAVKKKYKKAKSATAWSKQRLFLNLLQDAKLSEQDGEQGVRYGFAFVEDPPQNGTDQHWIKIGRILDFDSVDTFDKFKDEEEDKLPGDVTKAKVKIFRANLDRLHGAIWKEQPIAYHTEMDQDYDRVLDIFVRANDGGVKLSKSDLLLSMITAKWGDLNAREEIYGFVDRLNTQLGRKNDFDKDFIMKTCLVVSDLPVEYKVENFNNRNLETIQESWKDIQTATERAVRLINSFGIDRDTLTGANAIIPIIYYLRRQPKLTLGGSTNFDVTNTSAIRVWLTAALLRNVFSGHSDTALRTARAVMQKQPADAPFPVEQLNAEMAKEARSTAFDDDAIEEILNLRYGEARAFLALSLLYDDANWSFEPHMDHIFPQSLFTKRMKGDLMSVHRLGNLELLTSKENQEKSDQEFGDWINSRHNSFLTRQLIPRDSGLWTLDNFERFLQARENLIRERFKSLFVRKANTAVL